MKDDHRSLCSLLKRWQPRQPEISSGFSEGVWTRIRREPAVPRGALFRFPTSLRAAACWAAALSAFGGSAAAYAYDSLTRDERMATAHVRAIDPLQITAAPNTVHRR